MHCFTICKIIGPYIYPRIHQNTQEHPRIPLEYSRIPFECPRISQNTNNIKILKHFYFLFFLFCWRRYFTEGNSSILVRTKPHLRRRCEVVLPEVTWPEVAWPEDALTGRDPVRKYVLRMRNRKLRNIRHIGAFSSEVTSSNGTWPLWVLLAEWGARMRNRKLRNLFPRFFLTLVVVQVPFPAFFSYCSTSTMVTEGHPKGWKGCAHVQPEVAPFSPEVGYRKWGFPSFTRAFFLL